MNSHGKQLRSWRIETHVEVITVQCALVTAETLPLSVVHLLRSVDSVLSCCLLVVAAQACRVTTSHWHI
jgi:hypothetical protein